MLGELNQHLAKRWRSWLIAFFWIAAFVVFWLVALSSDVFQECIRNPYYNAAYHEPKQGLALIFGNLGRTQGCLGEFLIKDGEAITAFFTLVLSLSTIGLWVSTKRLWKVTDETLRHSEKTAERQLRAYVCVTKVLVENFGIDMVPKIIVLMKNTGQTPAYRLAHWCAVDADDFPRRKPFKADWDFTEKNRALMGPNEGATVIISPDGVLGTDHVQKIKDGKGAIWAFGEIRYSDAFGMNRWTKFRLLYGGSSSIREDAGSQEKGAMASDEDGNDAN